MYASLADYQHAEFEREERLKDYRRELAIQAEREEEECSEWEEDSLPEVQ